MAGPVPPLPPPDRGDQVKVRGASTESQLEIRKKYFQIREEQEQKTPSRFAWITGMIKKVFDRLTSEKGRNLLTKDAAAIRDDLRKLKKYLGQLIDRDESENPLYIEKLSSTWEELHQLTETGALIEPQLLDAVAKLQYAFEDYPKEALHSFHFYLVKHAGMSWFPFPFLEMLKSLHQSAQDDPENCELKQWISLIDPVC